jgi:adenine deaminase
MAAAVNRLHKLQGGVVVCEGGKIRAELGLPIFGVISDLPVDIVAAAMENITKTLYGMGVPHPDPVKTAATLTSAAIPFFKICEEGYVRMKDGTTLGLFADNIQ